MSKQLSNIQTETRVYLDEASQLNWIDTTDVIPAINHAYHNVAQKVMEVNEKWYETTSPFNYAIVANQQEYAIDSSIIKPTRVEIDYNATGLETNAFRAVPINSDEIRGNLGNTNNAGSFFSAGYYIHGNIGAQNIGFVPVPTTADTGGKKSIWVWGIALPTDLVNSTDNVNIPWADNYSYLIALRAAAQLLRKGQQEDAAAAQYMVDYEEGVIEMQNWLKDRIIDDGVYVIDSTLEQTDFSTLEIV